ncbi:MAG: DUF2153 family protein [Acidilobus sp.]
MSQYRADLSEFLRNLDRWIAMQQSVLQTFKENEQRVAQSDRLEIIVNTRLAFSHMMRTLKAFDDWLQDPFITTNAPKDLLVEVWQRTVKILEELLELDIEHTTSMRNTLEAYSKQGKLNPILTRLREIGSTLATEQERGPRGGTTISF